MGEDLESGSDSTTSAYDEEEIEFLEREQETAFNEQAFFQKYGVKNRKDGVFPSPLSGMTLDSATGPSPGVVPYRDYDTVDWVQDKVLDMQIEEQMTKGDSWLQTLVQFLFFEAQMWIVLFLVGFSCAVIAYLVDLGLDVVQSSRLGVCMTFPGMPLEFCCPHKHLSEEFCPAWIRPSDVLGGFKFLDYLWYVLATLLWALLSSAVAITLVKNAIGSGVPEVKTALSGFVLRGPFSIQTMIVKAFSLMASAGSGLVVGKEGPLVHLSACVSEMWCIVWPRFVNNDSKHREIMSAGAAAAVAVAFGAPIGGVLFSLEEVSYYFSHASLWRSFVCATISLLFLNFFNPYGTGNVILYKVTFETSWLPFELLPFFLLGLLGAGLGTLFIKILLRMAEYRAHSWMVNYPFSEVAVLAVISGVVMFPNDLVRDGIGAAIGLMFKPCTAEAVHLDICDPERRIEMMLWTGVTSVILFLLASVSTTAKIPAGLYVPSLVIGACFGRCVGLMVQIMLPLLPDAFVEFLGCESAEMCVDAGPYGLLGAAAMLCGVTRMSVALVLIMLELTSSLDYLVPILLVVVVTKGFAEFLYRPNVYEGLISLKNHPFLGNKIRSSLKTSDLVGDCLRSSNKNKLILLRSDEVMTVEQLQAFLTMYPLSGYPIVCGYDRKTLFGYISDRDLRFAAYQANKMGGPKTRILLDNNLPFDLDGTLYDASGFVSHLSLTVSVELPVLVAYDLFEKIGYHHLLCSDSKGLCGIVTKKDLIRFIRNRESPSDSHH